MILQEKEVILVPNYEEQHVADLMNPPGPPQGEEYYGGTSVESRRGARAVALASSHSRTFGAFFGKALTRAGTWAAFIGVAACLAGFYQWWNAQAKPGPRQLIPGLVLGVAVVVLVFSLWLWAYRHNDKGTTLGTIVSYGLLLLSLCTLVAVWVYYPVHFIGVAAMFALASLVVELSARKHGERQFALGEASAIQKLSGLAVEIHNGLSMTAELVATTSLATRSAVDAAEKIDESSQKVSDAAGSAKAAMTRAIEIRNNFQREVDVKADELVPKKVSEKDAEAAEQHMREIAEAREAGRRESAGEIVQLKEQLASIAVLIPVLKRLQEAGLIDDQGNIIDQEQAARPEPYTTSGGRVVPGSVAHV